MIRALATFLACGSILLFGCFTSTDPQDTGACLIQNGGCDPNAYCSEDANFTYCECMSGYTGDGTVCTPVSLSGCAIDNGGCDANAYCTEDADFTYCQCMDGYTGDGTICEPIPLSGCALDNGGCDLDAICTEDAEFTYCECASGYAGDGFYCEPATFPEMAYTFINDEVLDELEFNLDVPIHYGSSPPDITGTYWLNSLMDWVYDDISYDNYYVAFSSQNADGAINVCTYSEDSTDSACSVAAYISGWGDECFTVYANSAGRVDACEYDATSVYSGCIDDQGDLVNYFEAFYDRNQMGNCGNQAAIGELTVVYEDDGLAEWTASN